MAFEVPSNMVYPEINYTVTNFPTGVNNAATTDCLCAYQNTTPLCELFTPAVGVVSVGKVYVIADESGNAGSQNITIQTSDATLISGNSAAVVQTNYGALQIYCNGSNWFIFGQL